MCRDLVDGALLISDAHYTQENPRLLKLLERLDDGTIDTPQLILMGDIFDLLFGQIPQTHTINAEAIELLRSVSNKIPTTYFEGNHDFNLETLFDKIDTIKLQEQPMQFIHNNKRVYLAHGDFNQPLSYRIYSAIIRDQMTLKGLDYINTKLNNTVLDHLQQYLKKKNNSHLITDFQLSVNKRLKSLNLKESETLIEGHYHQGVGFELESGASYFNLSAFVVAGEYAVVQTTNNKLRLRREFVHL